MKSASQKTILITVLVTAVLTAALITGGAYLLGFHRPHQMVNLEIGQEGEIEQSTLWTCGMHPWIITEEPGLCPICNMDLIPKRESTGSGQQSGERTVAYWRAPMDPMEIYDSPGKSKMGMDLVPVYEDEIIGGVSVSIDPVTVQNMGLRMETATKDRLISTIRTYGHITFDETRTAEISPKISGWIETLHVDFTGTQVSKGQPLLEIYSPQLLSTQEEYLSLYRTLKRSGREKDRELLDSARKRLRYFDVAEQEIQAIEQSGNVSKTLTIRSPFSGVVTATRAIEGGYVNAGNNLYTIADLSTVWVEAHIYEYELDQVHVGQQATMELPYLPGRTFSGKVWFIYPFLQEKTRDVVILLSFDNPELRLKPEMYGDVMIITEAPEPGIVIPAESVIRSGERNLVFVARGEGRFTPRQVRLGRALDDNRVHVLEGVAPGERVVTSGQFLLDSESKLQEAVKKMMDIRNPPEPESDPSPDEDFFDDMDGTEDSDFFEDMES